jgi:hypothetical protein
VDYSVWVQVADTWRRRMRASFLKVRGGDA